MGLFLLSSYLFIEHLCLSELLLQKEIIFSLDFGCYGEMSVYTFHHFPALVTLLFPLVFVPLSHWCHAGHFLAVLSDWLDRRRGLSRPPRC